MDQEPIPPFTNEQEEAAWWDAHPHVLRERFRDAQQQGTIRRLSQTTLPGASETVTIRIPREELTRARHLAANAACGIRQISRCCCMKPWKRKKRSWPADFVKPAASQ